ncbi:MAG: DUF2934 domain-containing protein [Candidatus Marinimicrobia bacterium]|nr:DUF2934 domain-containing protein [Candidatus Neomarinimicrobiota bacterium]
MIAKKKAVGKAKPGAQQQDLAPATPRKAPAQKAPAKKAAVRKTPVKKKAVAPPAVLSSEERYRQIQQAAYFLAEKNGFRGDPLQYWTEAEQRINAQY